MMKNVSVMELATFHVCDVEIKFSHRFKPRNTGASLSTI